jgi:CelD/BcsL family acetyltransferase involved in cellulose biosynthesis
MPASIDESAVVPELELAEIAMLYSHPLAARLPRVARLAGALRYVPRQYRRFQTDLTGGFQEYLKKFGAKSRETLRRKVRRFCAHVGSQEPLREYRTPEELRAFHPLGRQVSSLTFQERNALMCLPESPEHLEQFGEARAFLLFHGERPVSYLYVPIQRRVGYYQYVGHDPAYADHSAGSVLLYLALERLFADPDLDLLDFTEGEGSHKEFFSTSASLCGDAYYFRPTAKAQLAVAAHHSWTGLRNLVYRLAGLAGIRARLRQWLRTDATLGSLRGGRGQRAGAR